MTWPAIGYGTSPYRSDGRRVDLESAVSAAVRCGYRLFDVAEMYGNETVVGRALGRAGIRRDELVLVGKAWRTSFRPQSLRAACEGSLRRLGVAAFDAYLLHAPEAWQPVAPLDDAEAIGWPELERRLASRAAAGGPRQDDVPLAETWEAMLELRTAGLARAIGVSNFGVDDLERLGESRPQVNEIACTPLRPQAATSAWCAEHGVRILVHSPLSDGGVLRHPAVAALARERHLSPAQLLLGWNLARGSLPLPASTRPEHMEENLGSVSVVLDAAAIERLDRLGSPDLTLPEGAQ